MWYVQMLRSLDTECRKPQVGARCQYANVHTRPLLLQAHRSQLAQCVRTLCGDFLSLAFVYRRNPMVHGASMIQHVQACEHAVSHGCTRQHVVQRGCYAPLHQCPSSRLLTCIGDEIHSWISSCCGRSVPAVAHII